MAEKTISTRQKQKYDTSSNWTANNIVLLAGEIGIESDTNKFKIGNGTSTWNELDYVGSGEVVLYSTTGQNTDGAMTQKAITDALPQCIEIEMNMQTGQASITVEQFEKLLENQENYIVVNMSLTDSDGSTRTESVKFIRGSYRKEETPSYWVEKLFFNSVNTGDTEKNPYMYLILARHSISPNDIGIGMGGEEYATVNQLNNKVDKVTNMGLSTNDYTTADKNKLAGIEAGAEVNTVTSVNGKTGAITLSADDVNALPNTTVIPTALSDLTSDITHRTVTDIEKSTWNAKSDFSGSYNDLTDKPDISPNLYDLIITSQTEFDSFCLSINNSTCTAASVLFVGDGGDLEFTKSDGTGIQLPTTLKIISGINNAIINLGSISTNGLYYETRPTSDDYSINNITIRCSSSTAGNDAVISNCINLTNVTALSIGSVATLCPSAFKNCYYLNYCIANGAAMRAYDNCRYLHDCRGTSTGSYASSDTYSFCTYLDGCYGDSNASTYYYCTNLVGCRSNSGYRGFYNCSQVKSCSSTASYRSYDDCYNLYDCEANRSSSTSTS